MTNNSFRLLAAAIALVVPVATCALPVAGDEQTDGIGTFLSNLETSLAAGRLQEILAMAPALPHEDGSRLAGLVDRATSVTLRERARDQGHVLVDAFVTRGPRGRLSRWALGVSPTTQTGRFELVTARELGSFGGLVRLELDQTRQFDVRDLKIAGTDFELTMGNGRAFAAVVDGIPTALVLRGSARVQFSPPLTAEQDQLRIFAGEPALTVTTDEVFVRLSPDEFRQRIDEGALRPMAPGSVDRAELRRAMEVFEARAGLSFHLSASDLDAGRWSLEPPAGNLLVDFRSNRFGWLTYALTPENPEDIALFDRARGRQISIYASPDQRARIGMFYVDGADEAYEITHTDLDLTFAPARRWIGGRASVRLVMRQAGATVRLRLAASLVIGSVTSPELGSVLVLRAAGQEGVVLGLPDQLSAGRTFGIDVQYHGRLEPQAIGGDGPTAGTPGLSQPGVGSPRDDRFLYSTREAWYPQGAGRGHTTARVRLTVPSEYTVLSTGELIRADVSDADSSRFGPRVRQVRTFEHVADRPVRYLAFLAARVTEGRRTVARFTTGSAGSGEATVDVNVLPISGLANRGQALASRVRAMVEHFGGILGSAPYPSLSVAALEEPLPGGHSPAYFSLISQPPPTAPVEWLGDPVSFRDAPDFFLAHEVAHQWWGQAVGPKNYHEQWISEGFAQYFAWLYTDASSEPGVGARIMTRMRDTALERSHEGPIHLGYRLGHLRRDSRAFRAIVYNKSAAVLHMLRRLIGDQAFFAGLRRLYSSGRFTRIGTDDVQRAFEVESARPLGQFFERWVMSSAVPEVKLAWTATSGGSLVRVEQLGPVFDFPLDVMLRYADGHRERHTFIVTRAAEVFRLPSTRRLEHLSVDDPFTIARVRAGEEGSVAEKEKARVDEPRGPLN